MEKIQQVSLHRWHDSDKPKEVKQGAAVAAKKKFEYKHEAPGSADNLIAVAAA